MLRSLHTRPTGTNPDARARSGPVCPYCQSLSVLVDAAAIYGPKYEGRGNYWACRNYPECDSYVGTHRNSMDAQPLGSLANKALRNLRMKVHAAFDPLWLPHGPAGPHILGKKKSKMSRTKAYKWLAEQMSMEHGKCHISWFSEEICIRALMVLGEPQQDKFAVQENESGVHSGN